jgi:YHS domain-containing protein
MKYLRYVIPTLLVAAVIVVVARHNDSPSAPSVATAQAAPPKKPKSNLPKSWTTQPPPGTKARCAVTDEEFTVSDRTEFVTYQGRVYGFCCNDCKPEFEKNPLRFATLD